MTATATQATSTPQEKPPQSRSLVTSVVLRQETTLAVIIILIGVFVELRNSTFTSVANLTHILQSTVIYFVMACGAALLMIGGGLDFSVGSVFTLGGITTAWTLVHGVAWPAAIALGIGAGIIVGVINNLIISRLHVPPIIATLGTFFIILGLNVRITGGTDILPLPTSFQQLGQTKVLGVSVMILYALAVGVVFWFILQMTRFGVNVRALGGSGKPRSATASGFNDWTVLSTSWQGSGCSGGHHLKWMASPVWSQDGVICNRRILQESCEANLRQGRGSEGSGGSLQLESRRKGAPRDRHLRGRRS